MDRKKSHLGETEHEQQEAGGKNRSDSMMKFQEGSRDGIVRQCREDLGSRKGKTKNKKKPNKLEPLDVADEWIFIQHFIWKNWH